MAQTGFEVVEGDETVVQHPATAKVDHAAATQMLMLALKALSQRALVAASTLFTAAGLFSAWWLWSSVLPNPTTFQLVGLGGYAIFILALEWVRRR